MSGTQTGFFDSLVAAVRENPLAAALIGGGAVWLLVGDEKPKSAARSATAAPPTVDIGARNVRVTTSGLQRTAAPPTAPEMDHEGSFGAGETLRDAGSTASDAMSGAADKIRDRFDEGVAYARENIGTLGNPLPGKAALTKAQSSLADVLERQPLVLGAVGLAIGAAVAGALRTSDLENEWIGDLSDDVKTDLNARAGAVSQSLREASDTLKAELSDTGAEAVDRVKQAGIDAADAAREKVKSP
ncbi:hypothetical protein [Bradyrhizobium sp. Leo170]|uniref:hypothetical protein n=1 Tax=Bradyrhizobium sp. Leo170 TaxID=1571199 RepID=UPI00102E7B1F|nr:hypothetical protein [Bradyrhizobium sp. Leo170]TAI61353.1 hypothetical protein CWO89_35630 [Bradyrhizobium sp. Leo170]